MYFGHSSEIWRDYPELVPGVLLAESITRAASVGPRLERFYARAAARLSTSSEGELPEIQAWRRVFSRMGLKPTQYRCASESLLRRFRKETSLPRIHPLIDLCNAVSLAFAVPIAVFDVARIAGGIEVRRATGAEVYLSFAGEEEHPEPGEVVFADEAATAHARRWTNRQSRHSAIGDDTTTALIVAEAVHGSAAEDMRTLTATLAEELDAVWSAAPTARILTREASRVEI